MLGSLENFLGAVLSDCEAGLGFELAIEVVLLVTEPLGDLGDFHAFGSRALEQALKHPGDRLRPR